MEQAGQAAGAALGYYLVLCVVIWCVFRSVSDWLWMRHDAGMQANATAQARLENDTTRRMYPLATDHIDQEGAQHNGRPPMAEGLSVTD